MTAGIASAQANSLLDTLLAATKYAQLHTGDPGAAGTANVSSVTTRPALTFSAAASGSKATSSSVSWTNWAGTNNETVTHVSIWTASSAGTFVCSIQLTASKTVATGDTLNLNTLTASIAPLAA